MTTIPEDIAERADAVVKAIHTMSDFSFVSDVGRDCIARALLAERTRAQVEAVPVAWRLRIGDSDLWSYTETEQDADFYIKASGLRKSEKQPLYLAAPIPSPVAVPDGAETDSTTEYEITQEGEFCAASTSLSDAFHYAAVYGQDGPVEIWEVKRKLYVAPPALAGKDGA